MGASVSVNENITELTNKTITNMTTNFVNDIKTKININIVNETSAK